MIILIKISDVRRVRYGTDISKGDEPSTGPRTFASTTENATASSAKREIRILKTKKPVFHSNSKSKLVTYRSPDLKRKHRKFRIFPICLHHVCPVCLRSVLTNHFCFSHVTPAAPPVRPIILSWFLHYERRTRT